MSLIAELKRRKVFRVAVAYLAVAWVVAQVAALALPAFEAPAWVLRVSILLLALGFPLAVALAWALDVTPEGVKLDGSKTGTKRIAAICLALVVLSLGWYQLSKPEAPAPVAAAAPAPAASPQAPDRSIAVLAFADMSADHGSEYLGDGIAEEILNALAKVDGLKVAGRTSSFRYKGKELDLRDIGRELGVAHVLEGSVRRQGDQVRITAQLIRASDGFHLWSETYPGTMDDVFALQENIARSVAGELKLRLSDAQAQRLVDTGTANTAAYSKYLEASAIFNRRDGLRMDEAIALLEQATRLDPAYARAYARLASIHAIAGNYKTIPGPEGLAAVQAAAAKAIELDPTLGEPHAALGLKYGEQRRFGLEREEFEKALALDPDDITTNVWHSFALIRTGYRREGTRQLDQALALDPLLPIALMWRSTEYVDAGELDQAERALRLAAENRLMFVGLGQYRLDRARGDTAAGTKHMAEAMGVFDADFPEGSNVVFAQACHGDAAARTEALRRIDAYLAAEPPTVAGLAPFVLLCLHEYDRALEVIGRGPTSNDALFMPAMFRSKEYPGLLESPGFVALAERIGLAAHWEKYGPPDACRRVGGAWKCG